MKIVIQCAGSKNQAQPGAGFLATDNRQIKFVASPKLAPHSDQYVYARPDDRANDSQTWRDHLVAYNSYAHTNPLHLLPAYQLYTGKAYQNLVEKFGIKQIFILSAGWGLIPADFLTPDYDITFSQAKNVAPHCRRKKSDNYADMCLLPDDGDKIIFLGGKDYLPLFYKMTNNLKGTKKVFFNASSDLNLGPGFRTERFQTNRRTNWHYDCAQQLIDGQLGF
jgi:hypothetical protein